MSKRRSKAKAPDCPACNRLSRLTTGREIYPHRPDLFDKPFYVCDGCKAYCGCHPGTTKPLGTPAGPELRKARGFVHGRLDPLWRAARDRKRARSRIYAWLSKELGIPAEQTHTGLFDIDTCRRAYRALGRLDGMAPE